MRIEKIREKVLQAAWDRDKMRRLARDLGHELPRCRLLVLQTLRAEIAGITMPADPYAQAWLHALSEVTAAYQAAIGTSLDAADAVFAVETRRMTDALAAFAERPRTAYELVLLLETDIDDAWSRTDFLWNLWLIEPVSAQTHEDKRAWLFRISLRGEDALKRLGRMPATSDEGT